MPCTDPRDDEDRRFNAMKVQALTKLLCASEDGLTDEAREWVKWHKMYDAARKQGDSFRASTFSDNADFLLIGVYERDHGKAWRY